MRTRFTYLADNEVAEIALPILRSRFEPYGFRDADIREEDDFDGVPVIRMIAKVNEYVPARAVIDTTDEIRVELVARGDERYVFLSSRTSAPGAADEQDVD